MCFPSVSANKDCICLVTTPPKLSVHTLNQTRCWKWRPSAGRQPSNIVSTSLVNLWVSFQIFDLIFVVIYAGNWRQHGLRSREVEGHWSIKRVSNNFHNASSNLLVVFPVAISCEKKLSLIFYLSVFGEVDRYQFLKTVCVDTCDDSCSRICTAQLISLERYWSNSYEIRELHWLLLCVLIYRPNSSLLRHKEITLQVEQFSSALCCCPIAESNTGSSNTKSYSYSSAESTYTEYCQSYHKVL